MFWYKVFIKIHPSTTEGFHRFYGVFSFLNDSSFVTANKVRFQHANALKFIHTTVDRGCYKEKNNFKLMYLHSAELNCKWQ